MQKKKIICSSANLLKSTKELNALKMARSKMPISSNSRKVLDKEFLKVAKQNNSLRKCMGMEPISHYDNKLKKWIKP